MITQLHIFSSWVELSTTTRRLIVAILLLSGVGPGQFFIQVLEDGCVLELTMMWSGPFIDTLVLHRKLLQSTADGRIKAYHPKLVGFVHHLKSFKSRNIDSVESRAGIAFSFHVQIYISQTFNYGWCESSARVGFVKLRGQEERCGAGNDNESFEIY